MASAGTSVTPRNLVRSIERRADVAQQTEDTLARVGMFYPRSPMLTTVLRIVSSLGLALGVVGLVLSVLGESDMALAASLALALISLVTLIWNQRRSWATRAGRSMVAGWKARHQLPSDRDRLLYETIVHYETVDLRASHQAPIRDDARVLLAPPAQ
jgi:uncharacterized protein (TIGR04222 family)